MSDADRAEKWAAKLAERKERYQERGKLYRIGWVLLGTLVTFAGCVMLVTPGPAFVVIPIGLAMLAMEFAWAENALEKALVQADKASQKAKDASRTEKIFGVVATVLGIGAAVAAWLLWDIPVIPG